MKNKKIPVTIITGFLGAGKTTLLNNLIIKHKDKKFAIIENEIGEIGIDGDLIVGVDDNIFELSNGCICCSLNDEFQKVVSNLLDSKHEFNHLIIETTGIADPDSVIEPFISSVDIQNQFILDSVISLADAVNVEDTIVEQPEIRKQLALADTILLNKTESISKIYCTQLLKELKIINPSASIYPVSYCNITEVDILDTFMYTSNKIEETTSSFQNLTFIKKPLESGSFLQANTDHHHHIQTEGFMIPGNFDYDQFNFWIRNYLLFNTNNIYRVKGILHFKNKEGNFIFHSIRSEYILEPSEIKNTKPINNKLIFIGKNIQRDELEKYLFQLIHQDEKVKTINN